MKRFIALMIMAALAGCNTIAPVGDALPTSLDGQWRIDLLDAPGFACVEVTGDMLEVFDFGCTGDNLLSSSGRILYDEQGPAFSVVSAEEGQLTFWLTRAKGGYVVVVERATGLGFGFMTQLTP